MSSSAIKRAAPASPLNAALATAQVWALASNPIQACVLGVPGKLALESKRFTVRAEGNMQVAAGATTGKLSLLAALLPPAAPLVAANWTLIGSGTARAVASLACPFFIEANLIFDSISGLVQGSFQQLVANLFDGSAPVANVLSGVNGTNVPQVQTGPVTVQPTDPVFYLAAALTFSAAAAGNVGNLVNFELAF